jgi:hypothetical protein
MKRSKQIITNSILEFIKLKSYRNLTISAITIVFIGMVLFHYIEGWRWIDSLYYSVITLTTVGFGDITPKTDLGKVLTIFYIISGVGIIFGFMNAFYQHRISNFDIVRKKIKKDDT